jgi:phosphoglucosamine mutase
MFGTSGIRGTVGGEITCGLFQKVAMAAARPGIPFIVATDTRPSGAMLKSAFVSGVNASGSDSYDIGIAPTPALAYATWKMGHRGAMITASHNPPECNGLKLFENGLEIPRALEAEIAQRATQPQKPCEWSRAGGMLPVPDVLSHYLDFLLKSIDVSPIKKTKPRIVVDCGNGAGSVATPHLLSSAGAHVLGLNCELGGHFNRPLEPSEKNLSDACKLVRTSGSEFGIAHDGDADRAVLIDERGRLVPQDVALSLMIQYGLPKEKKPKPIATTVEASLIVREAIERRGSKPIITPVGSMHIAHEVKRDSLLFGGEPCGEYVFGNLVPAADGVASALMFARIISSSGQHLSSLCSKFRQFPIVREKFACKDKGKAMEKLKGTLKMAGKRSELDGLRFDFPEGWVLVRPSGTEPVMRLTCESKSQKKLEEVAKAAREAIIAACR